MATEPDANENPDELARRVQRVRTLLSNRACTCPAIVGGKRHEDHYCLRCRVLRVLGGIAK